MVAQKSKSRFALNAPYRPTPDQKGAAEKLVSWIRGGEKLQTLLGVTGSGKTFTMANVVERLGKPTLVMSHNKTLAWQLYQEFKEYFPENEVHYFVSYYDYYQPEAYLPSTDTYIEKDARINETIDKLRHAATQAVLTRKDALIVASVSCIYNIGDPALYREFAFSVRKSARLGRQEFLRKLVALRYERNDIGRLPGTFEVKGETVLVYHPAGNETTVVRFGPNSIEKIENANGDELKDHAIFPAKHFVTRDEALPLAIRNIRAELGERLAELKSQGKILEAARLEQRTNYDLEMLAEVGYVNGIENYSRQLSFRPPGAPPFTLLDYFISAHKNDWLIFVDESHMSVPQIRGMHRGDQARKQTLVEHGFRLPSALDNRPLNFKEWLERASQVVFVSATPDDYEYEKSGGRVAEQLLRPTHILDPAIEVRPTAGQIDDLIEEIEKRARKKERVLVTVITKRLAEDLAEHLEEKKIKAAYLHSEIHTLERPEILADLRRGEYDVLVGVNLLREGLDLPEVSLVAILDADKEGFLRNETTLVQTMGRAARHPDGKVIMYADVLTGSMKAAIRETERRRVYQAEYNQKRGLKPRPIKKKVAPKKTEEKPEQEWIKKMSRRELERELKRAVKEWNFEEAILIRDRLKSLTSNKMK